MNKNDIFEVNIESYNSESNGVARVEGRAVFVPYAKIGETHRIKILKVTNSAVWAKTLEKLPDTDCPYFYKCGGCDCRHMTYDEELEFKLNRVNESLRRIGKQTFSIDIIVPSDQIFRYRNKAIYNIENNKFGFYRQRSHDLVEIEDCLLQSELSVDCAKKIASLNLDGVSKIFVRDTVCTIISKKEIEPVYINGLSGEVLCINTGRENSILNGDLINLYGDNDLDELLCGYSFKISPKSFFQINPGQAEKLYFKTLEFAGKGDVALELYCGVGTISMLLSRNFTKVIATEIVPDAIVNAKNNAKLNNINNIKFICEDASNINISSDVLVVDPPRKGLTPEVINSIKRNPPERIVYVSCNPATLSRDILLLNEYQLIDGCAFDMFPRTKHVETVVLMSRVKD